MTNYNSILDDERHYCKVDLLKHVDDKHPLKQLSLSIANATELPQSTVFLLGLGVFSSMATRRWRVNYQHGGSKPIALYVVAEQPSGTGKSRCLNTFQKPFHDAHSKHRKKCIERIKELSKPKEKDAPVEDNSEELENLSNALNVTLFVTNPTPEALEKSLKYSEGFFSAVSSEQGLFNTLLGLAYGDNKANNNDLVLNGFDGGYIHSMRVGREGYNGFVTGGITLFAQDGSVETVLKQSNGTGLSERFLMLAEKDNLGSRDWLKNKSIDKFYTDEYAKICNNFASDVLMNPEDFELLRELSIDDDGWHAINQYRNDIEPELKAGGRFSHASLRGAIGKVDIQIMKIAANLHILKHSQLPPSTIDNDTVTSAINIVDELMEAHLDMLKDKGAIGAKAEYSAIIGYLSSKGKGLTQREIVNSMRTTQPFKSMTGSKSAAVNSAIDEMVQQGLLTGLDVKGAKIYSIAG